MLAPACQFTIQHPRSKGLRCSVAHGVGWQGCFPQLSLLPRRCHPYPIETRTVSSVHLSICLTAVSCQWITSARPQSPIMQIDCGSRYRVVCGGSKCRCTDGLELHHITVMNKGLSSKTLYSSMSVSCRYVLYTTAMSLKNYKALKNLIFLSTDAINFLQIICELVYDDSVIQNMAPVHGMFCSEFLSFQVSFDAFKSQPCVQPINCPFELSFVETLVT